MTATLASFGPFHVDWITWAPTLGNGILKTLEFTFASFAGAAVVGLVLALMRESPVAPVRWAARVYTEIFKNLPLLTEIFLVYFGLASLGLRLSVFEAGCVSLVVFYAAYLSEIFRGGLQGVAAGPVQAFAVLGDHVTADFYGSRGRLFQQVDAAQQRGLAAAALAHQADDLTPPDHQVDPVQHAVVPEAFDQLLHPYHDRAGWAGAGFGGGGR